MDQSVAVDRRGWATLAAYANGLGATRDFYHGLPARIAHQLAAADADSLALRGRAGKPG